VFIVLGMRGKHKSYANFLCLHHISLGIHGEVDMGKRRMAS
jgi:hypothetical protein